MAFAILCFAAIGTNWGSVVGVAYLTNVFPGEKAFFFLFCSFAVAPSPTVAAPVIISPPPALKRLVVVYVLLVRVFLLVLLLLAEIEKIPPEMRSVKNAI